MTPKWASGGLALLAAVFVAATSSPRAHRAGPVWVIGDSIGVGIAAALRRRGVSLIDRAEVSTTTAQWMGRVRDLEGRVPAVVVVSLGTNDAVARGLREQWRANAVQVVETLTRAGHAVIWVMPPSSHCTLPAPGDADAIRAAGARVIQVRGVPMADEWHPTARGYDALAAEVDAVRRSLQQ